MALTDNGGFGDGGFEIWRLWVPPSKPFKRFSATPSRVLVKIHKAIVAYKKVLLG